MEPSCKSSKCNRPPKQLKSNAYQPVSTSLTGQTLIYMQMSNHYRRLENAKSVVDSGLHGNSTRRCNYYDTSPGKNNNCSPCEYTPRRSIHNSPAGTRTNLDACSVHTPSPSDMDLVDQIVYDNKHKPNAFYKDENGMIRGPTSHTHCIKSRSPTKKNSPTRNRHQRKSQSKSPAKLTHKKKKPAIPADIIDHHPQQFVPCKNFQPRILKSSAQSRVQNLDVYHPPRRRLQQKEEQEPQDDTWLKNSHIQTLNQVQVKITENNNNPKEKHWDCREAETRLFENNIVGQRPSSKGSTRSYGCDSAYNGGVSSGPESRGSTPERCPMAKSPPRSNHELRFQENVETDSSADSQDFPLPEELEEPSYPSNEGDQEAAYAIFLRQITDDILTRGIFTNKGINVILQRHIEENMHELDMNRMLLEISNLRKQLEIPEDDERVKFSMNSKAASPKRGAHQNRAGNVAGKSDCQGDGTQPSYQNIEKNKEPKSLSIEDMINDMEHRVNIEAYGVKENCCCQKESEGRKTGCGCKHTCSETTTLSQFLAMGHDGKLPLTDRVESVNYFISDQTGSPYYHSEHGDLSSIEPDEDNIFSDAEMGQEKETYLTDHDESMHDDEADKRKRPSLTSDPGHSIYYVPIEDSDSLGTAHTSSICSDLKGAEDSSDEDFMLEMMGFPDKDKISGDGLVDQKSEIYTSNDDEDEKEILVMKTAPSYDTSSKKSEENDDAGSVNTHSDITEIEDESSEGRTVYFNAEPSDDSGSEVVPLETLEQPEESEINNETDSYPELKPQSASSSKALVTFASDKTVQNKQDDLYSQGTNLSADSAAGIRDSLDRPRRNKKPEKKEKGGCFGACKKKKKEENSPPAPLKSALKDKSQKKNGEENIDTEQQEQKF